jgi:hypothetical protein
MMIQQVEESRARRAEIQESRQQHRDMMLLLAKTSTTSTQVQRDPTPVVSFHPSSPSQLFSMPRVFGTAVIMTPSVAATSSTNSHNNTPYPTKELLNKINAQADNNNDANNEENDNEDKYK